MVDYIIKKKGNFRDISCKMRNAGFDVSFRDCPTKGGTVTLAAGNWSEGRMRPAGRQLDGPVLEDWVISGNAQFYKPKLKVRRFCILCAIIQLMKTDTVSASLSDVTYLIMW
jgi:hypothetical protein